MRLIHARPSVVVLSAAFTLATSLFLAHSISAFESHARRGVEAGACTNASLSGSFGYTFIGAAYLGPDGTAAPGGTRADIVAVGIINYDGQGNASGNDVISRAGRIGPRTFSGTYTVNPDCTGTSTLDTETTTVHTSFVIDAAGTEVQIIVTDNGAALTGIARKQ